MAVTTLPKHQCIHKGISTSEIIEYFIWCSICLGDYQEKEILRIMPTCHHNFHLACIDEWLQKQSTCPICRLPLSESFEVPLVFGILQEMVSPVVLDDFSNQRVAPGASDHGSHDAISLNIDDSHFEPETGT